MRQIIGMRYALIPVTGILLVSCANRVWVRPGATQEDFASDRNICDYQAELATPDSSAYDNPRNMSDAIADGIVSGIADGIRKATLMNKCLIARGWFLQTVEPPRASVVTPVAAPTDDWSDGYAAGVTNADCNDGHSDLWAQGCKAAVKSLHPAVASPDGWAAGYAFGVDVAHCEAGHPDSWMQGCRWAVRTVHPITGR